MSIGLETAKSIKAYGALALGMGSRSLMARAEQQPYDELAAISGIESVSLVPQPD